MGSNPTPSAEMAGIATETRGRAVSFRTLTTVLTTNLTAIQEETLLTTPQPQHTDIELAARHADLLAAATDLLASAKLSIRSPGDVVILALAARVIQLAHAIQDMCERGYGGESAPLARAALSGTVALMTLCEPRRDGLARTFVESIAMSTTRIERIGKALGLEGDGLRELAGQFTATAAKNLEAFDEVDSVRLGGDIRTWHGLPTERDLFVRVGMTDWYDLFYGPFSDEAHVGARSLGVEAAEVQRSEIGLGPKWEPLWETFFATSKCVTEILGQLDLEFGIGRRAEVEAIADRFAAALRAYAEKTWP